MRKDKKKLSRYIYYYLGRLLHYPLSILSLIKIRRLFKDSFVIKNFDTKGKSSHFLFTAESRSNGKLYLLKHNNFLLKKYIESFGRKFLDDSEKFLILVKLKEEVVGNQIPSVTKVKGYLFMEFLSGCVDLDVFCNEVPSSEKLEKVSQQVETFFKDLHTLGYVHMDIKNKNILVDKQLNVFVIDWDNLFSIDNESRLYDGDKLSGVLSFLQNVKQSR